MKIKDINKLNRPRERMILNGPEALSNEELLAIIINVGNKEKSSIELASEIINKASNIKELFNLSYNELIKINGIKESKACNILASFELCKRAMSYKENNAVFETSNKLFEYLYPLMAILKDEALYVLFLNSHLRLIRCINYGVGEGMSVNFPKQKVLKDALRLNSCYVVLSHNHPSGNPLPSEADIDITTDLYNSLKIIGIRLIDHIVVGNNNYYSFSDEGILI